MKFSRKLIILAIAVVFIAAACNSQNQANIIPPQVRQPVQSDTAAKVDAVVNILNKSVDREDSVSTQSDSDIVESDISLINSYSGVTNENY